MVDMKKLILPDPDGNENIFEIIDAAARTRLDEHDTEIDANTSDVGDIQDLIGSGSLDTVSQNLIPAINELNAIKARVVNQGGWICLIFGSYIICSQQFLITPTAAMETFNRTVSLPFEMANTSYHIQMTPNSRVEADAFYYGAERETVDSITLHVYSSTTSQRWFFVTVLGRLAS